MESEKKRRVKLKGVLEHTSTSVEIKDDGSLVVEFYDFSDEAQNRFGNDVAYTLTVNSSDKDKILLHLMSKHGLKSDLQNKDELLLQLIEEQFRDYYGIQEWFKINEIPYQKDFDPWA
jgi:hypothetical protein